MVEIILKGHRVSRGKSIGEALVCQSPIEKGHELEGVNISDKILVFPVGKGSTVGSFQLLELKTNRRAPKAIINLRADPIVAIGAIVSNIPMVDRLGRNPLEIIKSGDTVEVDADRGIVKIVPK